MREVKEIGSLFGLWEVTTEGDVEGRTTQRLGVFEGWMDEIALHLANKSYYSLSFKRLNPKKQASPFVPTGKKAVVTLDISTGTWDMKPGELAVFMQERFRAEGRNVIVEPGGSYAGFTLVSTAETEEERRVRLRKEAREKLEGLMTEEEIKTIGL